MIHILHTSAGNLLRTAAGNVLRIGERSIFTPIDYGLLYNEYAAIDARGLANTGWHVPTVTEWDDLLTYCGGIYVAGGKLKEIGFVYWDSPNTGATNEFGFNIRGCGQRINIFEGINLFTGIMFLGYTKTVGEPIWDYIGYDIAEIINTSYYVGFESLGISVRLICDTPATGLSDGVTGVYTGNDGKVYRTVVINEVWWLADNLAETKYRNGDSIPEVTDNATWEALTTGALCAYDNDWNNV